MDERKFMCGTCGFTSNRKDVLKKHQTRQKKCSPTTRPSKNPLECRYCEKKYNHKSNCQRHEKVCKHRDVEATAASVSVNVSGDNAVSTVNSNNTDNSITDNSVNNNITIICHPSQKDELVSFINTDLDAVVALILKNPARFQLALQAGHLHEELARATHFGEIQKNRNVLSIEKNGTDMRVMGDDSETMWISKRDGLERMYQNNTTIAADKSASKFLDATTNRGVAFHLRGNKAAYKKRIAYTVMNKGRYYAPNVNFEDKIPEELPGGNNHDALKDEIFEMLNAMDDADDLPLEQAYAIFQRTFAHKLVKKNDQWWEAAPGEEGWCMTSDPGQVLEDCFMELLEVVGNDIRVLCQHARMQKSNATVSERNGIRCNEVKCDVDHNRMAQYAEEMYEKYMTLRDYRGNIHSVLMRRNIKCVQLGDI